MAEHSGYLGCFIPGHVTHRENNVLPKEFYGSTSWRVRGPDSLLDNVFDMGHWRFREQSGIAAKAHNNRSGYYNSHTSENPTWSEYYRNRYPSTSEFQTYAVSTFPSSWLFPRDQVNLGNGDFTIWLQYYFPAQPSTNQNGRILSYGTPTYTEFALGVEDANLILAYNSVSGVQKLTAGPMLNNADIHVSYSNNTISLTSAYAGTLGVTKTVNGHLSNRDLLTIPDSRLTIGGTCDISPIIDSSVSVSGFLPSNSGFMYELGIATSGISIQNLKSKVGVSNRYENIQSYSVSDSDYIQLYIPNGTGAVTERDTTSSNVYDSPDDAAYHLAGPQTINDSLFGSISVAPSNVVLSIVLENNTDNPYGLFLSSRVTINTPPFTATYSQNHFDITNYNIPSGAKQEYLIPYDDSFNGAYPLVLNSNTRLFHPTLDLAFTNTPSTGNYYADVKIYSARVLYDTWNIPKTGTDQIALYTSGNQGTHESLDLFLYNQQYSGALNLSLHGKTEHSGNLSLSMAGHSPSTQSLDLYLHNIQAAEGLDLVISGLGPYSDSLSLYTANAVPHNSGLDLRIIGSDDITSSFNMFLSGLTPEYYSTGIELFTYAADSPALFKSVDLVINHPYAVDTPFTLPLVMFGPGSEAVTDGLNLTVGGFDPAYSSYFPLFIKNEISGVNESLNLYIATPSGTEGAIPFTSQMNLFVARDSESTDTAIPLTIKGPTEITESLLMTIEGGYSGVNSSTNLYIYGNEESAQLLRMYMRGK